MNLSHVGITLGILNVEERIMRLSSNAAGIAALSICESLLLSLTENGIIDETEAKGILKDAASAHREAIPFSDGAGEDHVEVASLLESLVAHGDTVRLIDR